MESIPEIIEAKSSKYAIYKTGSGDTSLIMLHGFSGDSRSFLHLLTELEKHFTIYRIDLPGHGQSIISENRFDVQSICDDLNLVFQDLDLKQIFLYGYSMGARIALSLTVAFPEDIQGLILESGTYGIEDSNEAEERRKSDELLAQHITSNFDSFVTEWPLKPVFDTPTPPASKLIEFSNKIRKSQDPRGLASALRAYGTGSMPCVKNELESITLPVLILNGEADKKFIRVGKEMNHIIPNSTQKIIPKAGHRIHLERPDLYLKEIINFRNIHH